MLIWFLLFSFTKEKKITVSTWKAVLWKFPKLPLHLVLLVCKNFGDHLQKVLNDNWKKTHLISGPFSTGFDLLDVALSWGSGALWFAHNRQQFKLLFRYSQEYTDTNHSIHRKSFTFHLLEIKQGNKKKILHITTHLDPSNDNNVINKQLTEMLNYFLKWLEEWKLSSSCADLSVVLNGDFNIDSKSEIYKSFLTVFGEGHEIIDVYDCYRIRQNQEEEMTFIKAENDLVFWDYTGRIDYIFLFTKVDLSRRVTIDQTTNQLISVQTVPESDFVEFAVPAIQHSEILKYKKGQELSDHYAVTSTLRIF